VERSQIAIDHERLAEFCRRNHIRRLALFGSVLHDDFRPDSDVDVLVEFEPAQVPGLQFFTLEKELSVIDRGEGAANRVKWSCKNPNFCIVSAWRRPWMSSFCARPKRFRRRGILQDHSEGLPAEPMAASPVDKYALALGKGPTADLPDWSEIFC
jgi:predicted nucleotidyltransferase